MADTPDVLKRLEEQLADAQHDIWSHWMRWFFENDTDENRERWRRQMTTPYSGLSEREKESDRKVVREFMQPALCLTRALLESQGELLEKLKWVRVTVADYQRAFGSTPPEVAMLDRLDAAVAKAKAVRRGEGM